MPCGVSILSRALTRGSHKSERVRMHAYASRTSPGKAFHDGKSVAFREVFRIFLPFGNLDDDQKKELEEAAVPSRCFHHSLLPTHLSLTHSLSLPDDAWWQHELVVKEELRPNIDKRSSQNAFVVQNVGRHFAGRLSSICSDLRNRHSCAVDHLNQHHRKRNRRRDLSASTDHLFQCHRICTYHGNRNYNSNCCDHRYVRQHDDHADNDFPDHYIHNSLDCGESDRTIECVKAKN